MNQSEWIALDKHAQPPQSESMSGVAPMTREGMRTKSLGASTLPASADLSDEDAVRMANKALDVAREDDIIEEVKVAFGMYFGSTGRKDTERLWRYLWQGVGDLERALARREEERRLALIPQHQSTMTVAIISPKKSKKPKAHWER